MIFERGAGNRPPPRGEQPREHLGLQRPGVLYSLSFVQNEQVDADVVVERAVSREPPEIPGNSLIRSDKDWDVAFEHAVPIRAFVEDDGGPGRPLVDLMSPVAGERCGTDDQGTTDRVSFEELVDGHGSLHRLPEPHFVGKEHTPAAEQMLHTLGLEWIELRRLTHLYPHPSDLISGTRRLVIPS